MVVFLGCVIIGVVIGYILSCKWGKDSITILAGGIIGMVLGLVASFYGGSFVKKEIVVKKYFISPIIFDGKIIAGLVEDRPSYTLQIKEDDKTRLIKHCLYEKNIFFTCGDEEERYLEIKRSKTCRKNMWIWFFDSTGLIESKVVLKKGDSFLTLPKLYSL